MDTESGSTPHVVFITEQVRPGGKRSHVEALCAGLESIGWRATLIDWSHLAWIERAWVAGPMYALDRVRNVLGHRWVVPALNGRFRARLRALRSSADRIDIFHVQEAITLPAARDVADGIPVVLTVHGPLHREVASAYGRPLEDPTIRWLRECEAEAFREARAVISVDLAHAEYVRSLGRTADTYVIPNFVDTRRFHSDVVASRFPENVEAKLPGRHILLCPRRLVPKNGVAIAIRAMRPLLDRGQECALVIAGDGPERAKLEALVNELGLGQHVHFLGAVPSAAMPGLYGRARAVLVPSVHSLGVEEATSISALEGQACARPVIASNLGGLRQIIEHGVTGLLVPPGNPDAIVTTVERIIADHDLATRLSMAGAAHVLAGHSHVVGAREYAGVYRQILTGAKHAP